ncbi:MAG: glycerol kinase GlpK [Candidatus Omnitrophica bacterium]|nr:glycerol kinase GlpK [Candidatus Omnitrophota bacterium]
MEPAKAAGVDQRGSGGYLPGSDRLDLLNAEILYGGLPLDPDRRRGDGGDLPVLCLRLVQLEVPGLQQAPRPRLRSEVLHRVRGSSSLKPALTLLAIDQGTTGTRAILFDRSGRPVARAYRELTQHFPKPGWVEHDPEEIWRSTLLVVRDALAKARLRAAALAAVGITNQRETTILWDRRSGRPVHRAIVWQDRRTAELCRQMKSLEPYLQRVTGLVLDPYFSGPKVAWLLRHDPAIARAARQGRLAFGTVDSWLLWRLTGGKVHATDVTNASRTLLLELKSSRWYSPILKAFGIPQSLLPEVLPSSGRFGVTAKVGPLPAGIPVTGIAGDQQAALFGQGCVEPGEAKNTYGTGCFLLMQTGTKPVLSSHGLIATAACGADGRPAFALEGSVFIGGAAIQWLRDGLGLIRSAAETERIARSVADTGGVYMVPAFVGLGAPYWRPEARGLICGLTRGTGRAHLVRAALEGIAYQSQELLQAMERATGFKLRSLKVDGGAVKNNFLMKFQADLSGVPVIRPRIIETTALGAAQLAGLGVGFWSVKDLARMRSADRIFRPGWSAARRRAAMAGWTSAIRRAL